MNATEEVIASYPAYKIVRRAASKAIADRGFPRIRVGDVLGLRRVYRGDSYYQSFSPGSVVSYAQQYGEDPIEAVDRARANGHQLHWINARATCLHNGPIVQETLVEVTIGMVVMFEGVLMRIQSAPNDNLRFERVTIGG